MQKKSLSFWILIVLLIIALAFVGYLYSENANLQSEKGKLIQDNELLTSENAILTTDKENLLDKVASKDSQLSMLQSDVESIYKSCVTQNACRGRYPNVSWLCNNVGDEASNPSHTCVCDSSCNLKTTQL